MAYGVSLDACSSCSVLGSIAEKFIGENKRFWLVGVVTQNFRQHTHLAIPFHTSAPPPPPQSKSHSYTYAIALALLCYFNF